MINRDSMSAFYYGRRFGRTSSPRPDAPTPEQNPIEIAPKPSLFKPSLFNKNNSDDVFFENFNKKWETTSDPENGILFVKHPIVITKYSYSPTGNCQLASLSDTNSLLSLIDQRVDFSITKIEDFQKHFKSLLNGINNSLLEYWKSRPNLIPRMGVKPLLLLDLNKSHRTLEELYQYIPKKYIKTNWEYVSSNESQMHIVLVNVHDLLDSK